MHKKLHFWLYVAAGTILAYDVYSGYAKSSGQTTPSYLAPIDSLEAAIPMGIPLWLLLAGGGFAAQKYGK